MKAIIHFNGDSTVGIFSRTYEMPDLPDLDETDREYFRKEIANLYSEIDGESERAHVIFEPYESF